MTTYYIYEVPGHKIGATINWDKRSLENTRMYNISPIIVETIQGPNTAEMWQIVGDREWELANKHEYNKGEHYRIAREKRIKANLKGARLGGLAGKNKPNKHLRSLTTDQILEIKSKYIPKLYNQARLSKEYNVTVMTISNVLNNKFYKIE